MSINEESRLTEVNEAMNELPFPDSKIDEAIMNGFLKSKQQNIRKRRLRYILLSSISAALLFIGFASLLYASPAFANYMAKFPAMEGLINYINQNKGYSGAVDNDYMEEIALTKKQKGIKVTLDSAIKDESGMVIFYTIESDRERNEISADLNYLHDGNGKNVLMNASFTSGSSIFDLGKGDKKTETWDFDHVNLKEKESFKISFSVDSQDFVFDFSLKKKADSRKILLNKTVSIESQEILIKSVTIHPLRVDVHLIPKDEENSKTLLNFEDIRLVDEKGEVWGGIKDGLSGSGSVGEDRHIYLQSNYFKKPKELYLVMSKIQAVDKERDSLVIDTKKQTIIKAPDQKLHSMKVSRNSVEFQIDSGKQFKKYDTMIFGTFTDATGKEIKVEQRMASAGTEASMIGFVLPPNQSVNNPLTIKLHAYPTWIEEKVKIRLK